MNALAFSFLYVRTPYLCDRLEKMIRKVKGVKETHLAIISMRTMRSLV